MLFNQDRSQLRQMFFHAWSQYQSTQTLQGIEQLIVDVALRHPEYQTLLSRPENEMDKDYLPETGESNPFLLMGMHIAIEEQLSIDRPQGIREYYQRLCHLLGDEHAAQHGVMECLAQSLWQAQSSGGIPSEDEYLSCLARMTNKKDHNNQ